ncbi:MAG: OB-fold nucleic acid binding domain-containing protein, partial [Actinomycetota bacterium]|nr:OB-fold nucleic acid binding domain-containing protein [Actinomycetota bacterium]
MSAIAELAEDRVVEGVYAVAAKRRLRTRSGAPYLAVELVDASGRIDGRVWQEVELLDARFDEGDVVRILGRVERFRDRLQLDVRSLEPVDDVDPAAFAPALRRDADELDGFLEFLAGEIAHPGLRATVARFVEDGDLRRAFRELPAADGHHAYAGG